MERVVKLWNGMDAHPWRCPRNVWVWELGTGWALIPGCFSHLNNSLILGLSLPFQGIPHVPVPPAHPAN